MSRPFLRTIRSRVVALTIGVALVAVALTAYLVSRGSAAAVRENAEQSLETDVAIWDAFNLWALDHSSWAGVDQVVRDLSATYDRRIALVDAGGGLIADSDRLNGRSPRPLPVNAAALIDPNNPAAVYAGGGWLEAAPTPAEIEAANAVASRQGECLEANGADFKINADANGQVIEVLEAGDAGAAAFDSCVGIQVAPPLGTEIAAMAPAAASSAAGAIECVDVPGPADGLGAVPVPGNGDPAAGIDPFAAPEAGVAPEPADASAKPAPAGSIDPGLDQVVVEAGTPLICPVTFDAPAPAPPARLFLGTRADGGLSWRGLGWGRLAAIAAAVFAAAALAAWLVGRLITRPLGRLAEVAHRFGTGQRAARVEGLSHGEVGEVATAFNTMADALDRNEALRRRMVSDIAHELRNPLVTINGTLEAIQDGVYEPTPDVIDSLAEETEQLRRLVADLQELALADAGGLHIERETVDLADLARVVVDAHRGLAAGAGIDLRLDAPEPVETRADPGRLRQVFGNLLSNALRYTPEGGSVTVEVHRGEDGVSFSIADTGPGIADADLPNVFERFWRADAARTRAGGGSGLGLAITRELLRAHGGDITVSSAPGVGTRFTATLPVLAPVTSGTPD